MRKFLLGIGLSLAAVACGSSSSGPSRPNDVNDVLIGDLLSAEIDDVCNYTVDIEDGPADVTCSDGTTVHVFGFSECVDALSAIDPTVCDATAGDYMDCSEDHEINECDDTSIACQNTFNVDCL
jgi:hypothetical protein